MKTKEAGKIIICNATLMWRNPSSVPREKYILFVRPEEGIEEYTTARSFDDNNYGLTEAARLLADIVFTRGKIPEVAFEPEMDNFTVYADGIFGRPLIPAEVWVCRPLTRKQKKELSEKLVKLNIGPDVLKKLKLFFS